MDNFQQILFDKSIYEIGMLPQRSIFASSGRDWSLSGDWHILYRETFSPEILEVLSPQASIADLPKVTVPLPLELQGFGTPQYVNVQYPFDGRNPGRMGDEIDLPNACMLYLKDLSVPETVPGKRYFLNFKGSESAFFLYLNGRFVGYSENLFLDSEFDVTPGSR